MIKKKVIIVTGQTATGKTKLALNLAQKYNGELINCDSRQIYKHLNIVTGKNIAKSSKLIFKKKYKISSYDIGFYNIDTNKIWLYDIVDPKDYFSSFDFTQCALFVIKKLLEQKKTPILVGGSYFYIYHLLYKIPTETILPNWPLRKKLAKKTVNELQKILSRINSQSFNRLNNSDRNNPRRLIRKIEMTQFLLHHPERHHVFAPVEGSNNKLTIHKKLNLDNLKTEFIGLKFKNRNDLIKTIKYRVKQRLEYAAIEETKSLLQQGYKKNDPGLKTIGYSQIIQYIKGSLTYAEAVNQWVTKEIQYAKRQYTFMKKDPNIKWTEV